jgi:ATP-dependent RNA helicase RhlE
MSDFKSLNLNPKILNSLDEKGYTHPTPIQLQAIPHLLQGKDLLGIAQTGTGKTAAFSLPILDKLSKNNNKVQDFSTRVLILSPTRELASQIAENIDRYGSNLRFTNIVIFGGVNINSQIKAMRRGVDIMVATPGRLLDLMNQGYIKLHQVEVFVLDEADRMLDMGFIRDIKKIIPKLPQVRQNLLFSATMPKDIAVLANKILNKPIKVEVTPQATTVEKIDQKINFVEKSNKLRLLKNILKKESATTVLVFSRTKHGANKIVKYLTKESIQSEAIHGNKSQSAREKALDEFRSGKIKVLIATDIAARGIDVPDITHVINFDIPQDPESYVHRIGRTARAGRNGIAISFCDPTEGKLLHAVEKVIKYKIPVDESHAFHGVKAVVAESSPQQRTGNKARSNKPASPNNRIQRNRANRQRRT